MEKESKIGKSLEGDVAIPEFERRETEETSSIEKTGEIIQNQENESETIEISSEKEKTWFEIIIDARSEFPEDIRKLIDKKLSHALEPEEESKFDTARNRWWKEKFDIEFWSRKHKKSGAEKRGKKLQKKERYLSKLQADKMKRMDQLHHALKNLDKGEPVYEFRDETRRVLYYDEESGKYFVDDNGQNKYLGTGDILSDYAWGIKYVPDGDMIEPAYRKIVKRILTNEVRRDLEDIYDIQLELKHQDTDRKVSRSSDPIDIIKRWPKLDQQAKILEGGMVAEAMVRELTSRISINDNMNFYVARASALEDSVFKYDFKVRVSRNRGIEVGNGEEVAGKIKKLGIQFTIRKSGPASNKKEGLLKEIKKIFNDELPVDDIMYLSVPTGQFRDSFNRWLKNKPSGGPEQFLSRDLKIKLLKEVTRGLVDIRDEDVERIFPKESLQEVKVQPVAN